MKLLFIFGCLCLISSAQAEVITLTNVSAESATQTMAVFDCGYVREIKHSTSFLGITINGNTSYSATERCNGWLLKGVTGTRSNGEKLKLDSVYLRKIHPDELEKPEAQRDVNVLIFDMLGLPQLLLNALNHGEASGERGTLRLQELRYDDQAPLPPAALLDTREAKNSTFRGEVKGQIVVRTVKGEVVEKDYSLGMAEETNDSGITLTESSR
jgi:hypothetical protein